MPRHEEVEVASAFVTITIHSLSKGDAAGDIRDRRVPGFVERISLEDCGMF